MIAVEQAGVLRTERRSVEAGGQVIRVPLTEAMVPNVFVSVALVRGRTGEPGEEHDLNAPDLRFGVAELRVAPDVGRFEVAVDALSSSPRLPPAPSCALGDCCVIEGGGACHRLCW